MHVGRTSGRECVKGIFLKLVMKVLGGNKFFAKGIGKIT